MKQFKLIVASSRDFNNYDLLSQQVVNIAEDTFGDRAISIVSGMARGADALAVRFAEENNVLLHKFPADWDKYGKRAGYVRNEDMGRFADGLLAFWDGESRGTKHMIEFMKAQERYVRVVIYTTGEILEFNK